MILKKIAKRILTKVPLRNVIVLSSLNDFDCNSGALFKYMLENGYDRKYTFIWSTIRSDSSEQYKGNRKVKIYPEESRSLMKRYYYYVAKYFIWDNHPFTKKRPEQISIYATHGVPPLKITQGLISINSNADYALCPSKEVMDWEAREYHIDKNKLFICDQPRNDYLFQIEKGYLNCLKQSISDYSKTVLWMPTFRMRLNGVCDSQASYYMGLPLIHSYNDLELLNRCLNDLGILLIIKLHPQQYLEVDRVNDLQNIYFMKDNIINGKTIDINEIMNETDALLTDYSTVIWDYLLLDRPIGFVIPDMDKYTIGFAVEQVQDYMPGDKITTKKTLYGFFEDLLQNHDYYKTERNSLCKKMHTYTDGLNCRRFLEYFGI